MEPPFDIGTTPLGVAGRIAGSLPIDSLVHSVRLWALAAQPMPPEEFEYNINDAVMEIGGGEPGRAPDLVPRIFDLIDLRSGDVPGIRLVITSELRRRAARGR